MRRRDVTAGLLLAAAAPSLRAQEPAKQRRIAIVIPAGPITSISDTEFAPGGRFLRSCAGRAMSRDKTSQSSDIRARAGPRAMAISLARSSIESRR
jgi:hypothetical protein